MEYDKMLIDIIRPHVVLSTSESLIAIHYDGKLYTIESRPHLRQLKLIAQLELQDESAKTSVKHLVAARYRGDLKVLLSTGSTVGIYSKDLVKEQEVHL